MNTTGSDKANCFCISSRVKRSAVAVNATIGTSENVCPRFLPSEFGIDPSGLEREQLSLEL